MSTVAALATPGKALIRGHLTVTLPGVGIIALSASAGAVLFGVTGALIGAAAGGCVLGWPVWAWTVRRWRRWAQTHVVQSDDLERAAVLTGLVGPPSSVMAQAETTLNVPLMWTFIASAACFMVALGVLASGNGAGIALVAAVIGCLAIAVGVAYSLRRSDSRLARVNVGAALVAAVAFFSLPRVPMPVWIAAGVGSLVTVFSICLLALLIWLPQTTADRPKLARRGLAAVVVISIAASLWAAIGPVPRLTHASSTTQDSIPKPIATWANFTTGSKLPSITLSDGLRITDVETGTGVVAQKGDVLVVRYILWLDNGRQVDSSDADGGSFKFTLGTGMVIQGWDEGVPGMRVGGLRRLVIPPALAYGAAGAADPSGAYVIPPNATLVFIVRLESDTSRS